MAQLTADRRRRLPGHRVRHQHSYRQLADRELRHRRRARAEDLIRVGKDTGLTNLPLRAFDQNRIWCTLVMLAADLTTAGPEPVQEVLAGRLGWNTLVSCTSRRP